MGNRPCLVLAEWELLLIPPGWPMIEQTESCLFSGSRKIQIQKTGRIQNTKLSLRQNKHKIAKKPRKFVCLFFFILSFTQQMLWEWMWCQLLGKLITWHATRLNPANPIIYHPFRGPAVAIVTPSVSTATQGSNSKGEAACCGRGECWHKTIVVWCKVCMLLLSFICD